MYTSLLLVGTHCALQNYPYTSDLLEFDHRYPLSRASASVSSDLGGITSPFVLPEWEKLLSGHPDRMYCEYLLKGMREGFRIGFAYSKCVCISAKSNMGSASQNPSIIDKYVEQELALHRFMGPLDSSLASHVHVNRFGVIPKRHQPGKWRLITDLSHPPGASVNDGIEPELCSLSYTSVDDAVRLILQKGYGAQLAKLDMESAYRQVPVHPDDRFLLGMKWKGNLYVDAALPFGLRSAPKIFNAVADALHWILQQEGVDSLHYLDDYLLVGAPNSQECDFALHKTIQLCSRLGVPIATHKTEGPSTVLTFLGIELDTLNGILRLPPVKLTLLRHEIIAWSAKKSCSKRELLSLIGQLQHACCVVKPGRSFLRRMIQLSTVAKELHHHIRLNTGFRSDLKWWSCFLTSWNGIGMMSCLGVHHYSATITSDASGSWGCGAFNSQGAWFQFSWPPIWAALHITVKEFLPIVIAVALWGHQWQGKVVRCLCDNAAVVAVIRSGTSKDMNVMHLMRSLFFFTAKYNLNLLPAHIPGVDNSAADALSRNDSFSFLSQVPSARPQSDPIPSELLQALVLQRPDWTSPAWTSLFTNFSPKV